MNPARLAPALTLLSAIHLVAWQQQGRPQTNPTVVVGGIFGQLPLTPEQVSALQQQVSGNPRDFDARSRLLRFYADSAGRPQAREDYRTARLRHIQYLVKEVPETTLAGSPLCYVGSLSGPYADPTDHAIVSSLWLTQANRHFEDTRVVLNALRFLGIEDKQQAEDLFERAIAARPDNLEVVSRLGFFYAAGLVGADTLDGRVLVALPDSARKDWTDHCRFALDRSVNPHVLMGAGIALPNVAMRRTGGGPTYESWVKYSEEIRKRASTLDVTAGSSRTMPVEFQMFANESQQAAETSSDQFGGAPGSEVRGPLKGLQAPSPTAQIRVGGNVQSSRLISSVPPSYPPLALQARLQGTVRLQAVIAPDGTVNNIQVISGHPLLVQAAVDAVKTWTYQPTVIDDVAVAVVTTIDVPFTFGRNP